MPLDEERRAYRYHQQPVLGVPAPGATVELRGAARLPAGELGAQVLREQVIYRKLGVSARADAVKAARRGSPR